MDTVKVARPRLPAASVAEHDTSVLPIGNVLPDAGVQVTVGDDVTASVAVATNETALPDWDVASSEIPAGTVTIGAVVSRTVTVNVAVTLFPVSSEATHDTTVSPSSKVLPDAGVHPTAG